MKGKSFGRDSFYSNSFSTESVFEKSYLISFFTLDAWSFCTTLGKRYFRNV